MYSTAGYRQQGICTALLGTDSRVYVQHCWVQTSVTNKAQSTKGTQNKQKHKKTPTPILPNLEIQSLKK
jgi:hypothetical protein